MIVYDFETDNVDKDVPKGFSPSVTLYSEANFQGVINYLSEGEYIGDRFDGHNILRTIGSIKIPANFYVAITEQSKEAFKHHYITDNGTCTKTYVGPTEINRFNKFRKVVAINIGRSKPSSAILCTDGGRCFVYDSGKHTLLPNMSMTVTDVTLNDQVSKVNLYSDWSFKNLVQSFTQNGSVQYPVIIRGVEVI
jgi:hypothetical protein